MARIDFAALEQGKSVRRKKWDSTTKLFVANGKLVQQATGDPYPYDLSWYEIIAKDWLIL